MNNAIYFFREILPSFWYCLLSGLKYQRTWRLRGRVIVKRGKRFASLRSDAKVGKLSIGTHFICNNTIKSNSIGVIQPCLFNIKPGGRLIIGNNVGISGSTIRATESVTIGDNVLVGTGCLITDTDAHPLNWRDRIEGLSEKTLSAPIVIGNNVFIGARSIILKGVTIGERSVIGAGSVICKDVPSDCVVAGNPAKIVKRTNN